MISRCIPPFLLLNQLQSTLIPPNFAEFIPILSSYPMTKTRRILRMAWSLPSSCQTARVTGTSSGGLGAVERLGDSHSSIQWDMFSISSWGYDADINSALKYSEILWDEWFRVAIELSNLRTEATSSCY